MSDSDNGGVAVTETPLTHYAELPIRTTDDALRKVILLPMRRRFMRVPKDPEDLGVEGQPPMDKTMEQGETGHRKETTSGQKDGVPLTITISDEEEEVNDPSMNMTSTSGSGPMEGTEGSTNFANTPLSALGTMTPPRPPSPLELLELPPRRVTLKPNDRRYKVNKPPRTPSPPKEVKTKTLTCKEATRVKKRVGNWGRREPPRDLTQGEYGAHPQGKKGKRSALTVEQRNWKDLALKKWREERDLKKKKKAVPFRHENIAPARTRRWTRELMERGTEEVNDPDNDPGPSNIADMATTLTSTSTSGSDPPSHGQGTLKDLAVRKWTEEMARLRGQGVKGKGKGQPQRDRGPHPKGTWNLRGNGKKERAPRIVKQRGTTSQQEQERSANIDEEEVSDPATATNKRQDFDIWDLAVKEWEEERERKQGLGKMSGSETTFGAGQKGGSSQTFSVTVTCDDDGVNDPSMTLTSACSDHDHDPREDERSMNSATFPSSPDQDYFFYDDFYDFDILL